MNPSPRVPGSITEKEKAYRLTARTLNLFGHYYVGFEGKTGSQFYSDDKERVLRECAWVWGRRERKWLKRPEVEIK